MLSTRGLEAVDYLIIGHITQDIIPTAKAGSHHTQIGGTAAYAGLTAQALGLRVGVVTSWGEEIQDARLEQLSIYNHLAEQSTTFENVYGESGQRMQIVHHVAQRLDLYHIPETWRSAPIVHIAPVAQEVETSLTRYFRDALVCLTPQGFLRAWDDKGHVFRTEWPEARHVLRQVDVAIVSQEDIQYDPALVEAMAEATSVLVITNGAEDIEIYFEGQKHTLPVQRSKEVDPTGAGDIFAASFFSKLKHSGDALKAAEFAIRVAARSVEQSGLDGIPSSDDIYELLTEVY